MGSWFLFFFKKQTSTQGRGKCVEYATEKETKKEEQHRCNDDQNDRVYKQKKKGKLKANDNISFRLCLDGNIWFWIWI